jgi:hypothetical protein
MEKAEKPIDLSNEEIAARDRMVTEDLKNRGVPAAESPEEVARRSWALPADQEVAEPEPKSRSSKY